MKLSELFLNRFLYKDSIQNSETKDAAEISADSTPEEPAAIASGGAAQDINTSNVFINGAVLEPGTVPQTVLDVSNWGWGQTCAFTSTDADTVSWGAGTFTSASGDAYSISAGNTGNMAAKTYIYLDLNVSETVYQVTTTPATAVGIGKVLIAVATNAVVAATFALSEATQIVGDNIIANTINASKMNVGQLSAISADIGDITAGKITGITITGGTVQTAATGVRIAMLGATNDIIFFNDATVIADINPDVDGNNVGLDFNTYLDATTLGANIKVRSDGVANSAYINLTADSESLQGIRIKSDLDTDITLIEFDGLINLDIDPSADQTRDIGNTDLKWDDIWCDTLHYDVLSDWSDVKLKKNIVPIKYGLEEILQLHPSSFKWKKDDREGLGLIAQEAVSVVPDLVSEAKIRIKPSKKDKRDGAKSTKEVYRLKNSHGEMEPVLQMNYIGFVPILIRSTQQLDAKFEKEIRKINERIAKLEEKVV